MFDFNMRPGRSVALTVEADLVFVMVVVCLTSIV
jgi:hypothetical protein